MLGLYHITVELLLFYRKSNKHVILPWDFSIDPSGGFFHLVLNMEPLMTSESILGTTDEDLP